MDWFPMVIVFLFAALHYLITLTYKVKFKGEFLLSPYIIEFVNLIMFFLVIISWTRLRSDETKLRVMEPINKLFLSAFLIGLIAVIFLRVFPNLFLSVISLIFLLVIFSVIVIIAGEFDDIVAVISTSTRLLWLIFILISSYSILQYNRFPIDV